jgi:hypothetical protein
MSDIIRALSIHEASFPVYAELVPGGGNIVVCLRLQGDLSAEQAKQGLSHLMQAEASLQVACQWLQPRASEQGEKRPEDYYFVKVAQAVPFEALSIEDSSPFESTINDMRTHLLNQPFQLGSLLWRARLISQDQQHCLLLCINHSVSDGTSVYHLLKRWLLALNSSTKITATANELGLPLWHYMPKKISGFLGAFRSLGILSTFMKAQKLADQGLHFKVAHNVPIMEHRCQSTFRILEPESFSRLLASATKHNNSLHGLLSSAMLNVLLTDCKKQGRLENLKQNFSIPFVTTVNVRNRISPIVDDSVAGCLSSGVTSMVNIDQSCIDNDYQKSPWALGEQIAGGVKDALDQEQHWKVLRIYKLAGLKGLKKMFIDSSEKPLATPISFANLGPVSFDYYINRANESNHNPLIVTGYEAYAAFHASGAGVNIVGSTLKGALTLCLTSPDPVVSQQTLNEYADAVVELLQQWAQ